VNWMLRLLYQAVVFATSARVVVMGWSMYPTLVAGEYVLFNRLAYVRRSPNRGDVVLARGLLERNKAVIKRVVGMPGDSVQLSQGLVTVNEVSAEDVSTTVDMKTDEHGMWVLGQDEWFLLGDAMDMSTDSRSYGPVARKTIKARAWLVYWPLSRWRSLGGEGRLD
jgi:signal peptidase I